MKLEKQQFQRLLFRTAFCVMACDGEIHNDEIKEINTMRKSSAYFQGIDLTNELEKLLNEIKNRGKLIIDELVSEIQNSKLSTIQELLLLEITFRMIYADGRVDDNEVKLLRFLRSKLNVHDEIIRDRFGAVEYLFDKDYSQDIVKSETYYDLLSTISIPEVKEIQTIDFSSFKDEK